MVWTVRGEVDALALGPTLMHEHVFLQYPDLDLNRPGIWADEAVYRKAVESLERLYDQGIRTVVDVTVRGIGQCIPVLQRVADAVEMNIVVATGYYTWGCLPHGVFRRGFTEDSHGWQVPDETPPTDGPDPIVEMFVHDLEHGIEATGIRPAILKCATEVFGVTPGVERVLRAVAKAQLRTGAPITTHTHAPSRRGLDQQRIFAEEGVPLSRVVIGHSDDTKDLTYLEQLIDNGSYIGMDRLGTPTANGLSLDDRLDTIAELCSRGHEDRIVLSHDSACHHSGRDSRPDERTWFLMHDEVLPGLRRRGLGEATIEQMLIANPAAVLQPLVSTTDQT